MSWTEMLHSPLTLLDLLALGGVLLLNSVALVLLLLSLGGLLRRISRRRGRRSADCEMAWPVSIIVTARNEERSVVETVRSLSMLNYGQFEIVVVNDGSTDRTLDRLVRAFDLTRLDRIYRRSIPTGEVHGVYGSLVHSRIIVVDKAPGGRPDAVNAGINASRYPLVCAVNAGSIIEDDALLKLVGPFLEEPRKTVAAGGIVRVLDGCEVRHGRVFSAGLPDRALPILQAVEQLRAFLSARAGWARLPNPPTVGGTFALYRKQELIEVGGLRTECDHAELDLLFRLHRHLRGLERDCRIVSVPEPVCWTAAPSTVLHLWRQRRRLHRGVVRNLWRNRDLLFRPRYGALGSVTLPLGFLFELIAPPLEIAAWLLVGFSWMIGAVGLDFVLLFFAATVLFGIVLSVAPVLLGEIGSCRYPRWADLLKLIAFAIVENAGHRQLVALVKLQVAWELLRHGSESGSARDPGTATAMPGVGG